MGAVERRPDLTSVRRGGVKFSVAQLFPRAEPLAEHIVNERLQNAVNLTADILATKFMNMGGHRPAALIRERNAMLGRLSDDDLSEFAGEAFLLLTANKIRRPGRISLVLGTLKDVAAQLGVSWDDRRTMDALEGALDVQLTSGSLKKDSGGHYIMQI